MLFQAIIVVLFLIPNLAFATPGSCITNDGDSFAYEEFDSKDAADLFAGETLKENITHDKNIWRVYLKLPDKTCAAITED